MRMTSNKPYLLRALYEWILDNQLTPYIVVNAEKKNVHVPKEHIKEGKIVFNITPGIVEALEINNEVIFFDARFSGKLRHIYVPIEAILAIYAKENGRGMIFEEEPEESEPPPATEQPPKRAKPNLKVVK